MALLDVVNKHIQDLNYFSITLFIYIYIYIEREREREREDALANIEIF